MPHVPPPTGLFISAKRHSRIHHSIAVDPDGAGTKLGRNSVSLGDVAGPHPGGEAVGCIVRFRNEVIDIFEWNSGDDGPEDFLLHDLHFFVGVDEDCGLHKITLVTLAATADRGLRAFRISGFEIAANAVELLF